MFPCISAVCVDDLLDVVESLAKTHKQRRYLMIGAIIAAVMCALLVAATAGLTYVVVDRHQEMRVRGCEGRGHRVLYSFCHLTSMAQVPHTCVTGPMHFRIPSLCCVRQCSVMSAEVHSPVACAPVR